MIKKLENNILSLSNILLLVLNYFVGYMYLYPYILQVLFTSFNLGENVYYFATLFIYLFMIVFCIILGYPVLKESAQKFPKWIKFFEHVVLSFVTLYLVSTFSSAIVMLITGNDTSVNQELIIEAFKGSPFIISFSILFYAPLVEEMVFRGAIFRGLRSKLSFLPASLISGISFGFIHVFDSLLAGNFSDLWNLLTYGGLGLLFCYSYEKTKTIYAPMLLHFLNNLLGLIGIILSVYYL